MTLIKAVTFISLKLPFAKALTMRKRMDDGTAVQYVQPDIVRCGGITAIKSIAELCQQYQRHLAMHLNYIK